MGKCGQISKFLVLYPKMTKICILGPFTIIFVPSNHPDLLINTFLAPPVCVSCSKSVAHRGLLTNFVIFKGGHKKRLHLD